jgi:hypothetical protein
MEIGYLWNMHFKQEEGRCRIEETAKEEALGVMTNF